MSRTTTYREQHQELVGVVGQLSALLDPAQLAKDAQLVRSVLIHLAGKLNLHLAMEDKALYPQLLKHADPAVQAKAKAFIDEMGGIKEAFGDYLKRYPNSQTIQGAAEAFVSDTQGLIKVLAKRIQAEDSDLYAMVDQLG
jgi:hemerythrin-like domain-containing protein